MLVILLWTTTSCGAQDWSAGECVYAYVSDWVCVCVCVCVCVLSTCGVRAHTHVQIQEYIPTDVILGRPGECEHACVYSH